MKKLYRFDVDFINPRGNPGTFMGLEAVSVEEALERTPHMLAASSQWKPEQFKIACVRLSKNQTVGEVKRELR